jgi:predicted permease
MRFRALGLWLFDRALVLAPEDLRIGYGPEMSRALAELLGAERAARGRLAALWLWMRAMADLTRTVRTERQRRDRDTRGWFSGGGDDIRYVLRSWVRAKTFAVSAILTIALGLGLNAAVFSFADGFLFRPLPFDDPDRLYWLRERGTISGGVALDDYDRIAATDVGLAGMVHWDISHRSVGRIEIGDRWQTLSAFDVSPRFADIMGFRLVLGRPFRADEHHEGSIVPCWVSYRFWTRDLGGDPHILGRRFRTSGTREGNLEVVGVMPPFLSSFDLNNAPPDVVLPAVPAAPVTDPRIRSLRTRMPIVRLPPDLTVQQAEQRLQAIVSQVQSERPSGGQPRTIYLRSLGEDLARGGRPTALLLFTLSLLVIALVTLNVGHLLLTRAVSRAQEIGVRLALGASRWRIARILLVESLLLSLCGLGLGVGLGFWLSSIIADRVPSYPTAGRNLSLVPMSFNWRVVLFSAALALAVAIAGALIPAIRYSRARGFSLSRSPGGAARVVRYRSALLLLAAEIAVATVVMVGTLVVGLSIWRFLNQPLGFEFEGAYRIDVTLESLPIEEPGLRLMNRALAARLRAVPNVRAVGSGWPTAPGSPVQLDGRRLSGFATASRVDHGFLETFRIPLLLGRNFTDAEIEEDRPVALVDEVVARRLWPGQHPLGRVLTAASKEREIIGVVGPVRGNLTADPGGDVYLPAGPTLEPSFGFVVAAPAANARLLVSALTRAAHDAVPGGRVAIEPVTRQSLYRRQVGEAEFQGPIVAALGLLAFLLVGVGLFGIVTYVVEQRLREFGIRLALGARAVDIWNAVFRQSLVPSLAGLGLGLAIALWTTQWLRSLISGLTSTDLEAMVAVVVLVGLVAAAGAARPARLAMRVDPVSVLRAE